MNAAWVTARLAAYPPRKPRDFTKLDKLMVRDKAHAPKPQTWQEQLAIAQKWAAAVPPKR